MAPAPIILDTSDDLSFAPPAQPAMSQRNLILAPPSVSSHPEQLEAVFAAYNRASSDLQMLDRLSAGLISLPTATYDLVLILTGAAGERRSEALSLLGRQPFTAIVTSMKSGALFKLQDGPLSGAEAREAILAGLVQKDGSFEKAAEEAVAVPLKLGKKKTTVNKPVQINLDDIDGDDDLIDEEDLLTADDRNKIVQPPECRPAPGRRRRACKDCTCGLAERMAGEDGERQDKATADLNALKLSADQLNDDEVDFTVQGKVGSCGSCSLGDAFRCATCPYIGLPAFKPGEEVQILNNTVQL
ncbi:Fe-S cluster assembly protein-like protein [Hapsidospora chrysogenum ATCC 11550]|uniref:Fe-S cluster assembly protein-like protein n=1 Tax=Hapsidospora chrysogenum (strain ATCC 11550 / CBS 779.69 / DSM 880 / IAM 14645 / JCM 23072 / IMI 49137) TaxID=857340 RepID=A0A086TI67_HAPC1|nr:Fe-S cluster assembly protein-like protein [Hapsidospora chrysogenum ATCC 11550]